MNDHVNKKDLLNSLKFGQRVAEEEDAIEEYFVETHQWRQLFNGETDIVRGPKGSGKSALYLLLNKRVHQLEIENKLLIAGEKISGSTVFKDVSDDPPLNEIQFTTLWKTYFLQLVISECRKRGIKNSSLNRVEAYLIKQRLIEEGINLRSLVRRALAFASRLIITKSIEAGGNLAPAGEFSLKFEFNDDQVRQGREIIQNIDDLLDVCNEGLGEAKLSVWLAFDRLDVAFSERQDVEIKALRSLFRAYSDIRDLQNIKLKIFIRDDIWSRIFEEGFREASHLTRVIDISWDKDLIINMIARRILSSNDFIIKKNLDKSIILGDISEQQRLFYEIFPEKVDSGPKNPVSLNWMINRTQDGAEKISPREIIHLLDESRKAELSRTQAGIDSTITRPLISSSSLKEALSIVSKYRVDNTLLAEYAQYKEYINLLKNGKARHSLSSLKSVWRLADGEVRSIADRLVDIGFLKKENRSDGNNYVIPFL